MDGQNAGKAANEVFSGVPPQEAAAQRALEGLNNISGVFAERLNTHDEVLAGISRAVNNQDLTEKTAALKKAEANAALEKDFLRLLGHFEDAQGVLDEKLGELDDPRSREEKDKDSAREALERNLKYLLRKTQPDPTGKWFNSLKSEDFSLLQQAFLHDEIKELRSTLRQSSVRETLLSLKGGTVDRDGAMTKLDAPAYRAYLYENALASGDKDIINVFESPELEELFFEGDLHARGRFLRAKARAQAGRVDSAVRARNAAGRDLRTYAIQTTAELARNLGELANAGVFSTNGLDRLSRLLNGRYSIPLSGGRSMNLGTNFNPFLAAKRAGKEEK